MPPHPIARAGPAATWFVLVCAAFALACGGGGAPAKAPTRQVILASEDVDRTVGEDADTQVRNELGLVDDPELVAYVAEVGERLTRHAPRRRFRYRFQIVDQEAPNAFALPGGYIYVSRGLLTLTNSEDELANVLGHEIVHVASRHAAARQEVSQRLPTGFNWLQGRYLASYGRDQESEADRLGQGLAALAGYDPQGLATFLEELEHTERLQLGASRLPRFWDTHPNTGRRVAEAAARARIVRWKPGTPLAATRAAYLRRIEGLAIGTRASEGVFIGDRFLHSDLDFAVHFPAGWTLRNTHRAVGAVAPKGDAQVFLEHQGPTGDVEAAAASYLETLAGDGFEIEHTQALTIGERPAFRVEGSAPGGGLHVQAVFTFVDSGESIYRFTGVAPSVAFARYRGTLLNVPRSFRPLEPSEREQIQETRLRIAVANEGESLRDLSERTRNRWDLQETAVMNDVYATDALAPGQLVKVAVAEGYAEER